MRTASRRCVPTRSGRLRRARIHDRADVNGGGPARRGQRDRRHRRRQDGRLRHAGRGVPSRAARTATTPRARGRRPHRRHGLPRRAATSRTTGRTRSNFVLQDHMFEPNASWSLPAHLFMVSEWSAKCTQHDSDQLRRTRRTVRPHAAATPRPPPVARRRSTPGPTSPTCCTRRTSRWGYYVVDGHRARLRGRRGVDVRAGPPERRPRPASGTRCPYFDTVKQRRPARQHPVGRPLLRRRRDRDAARGLVDRAVGRRERAPAGARQRRADVRHQPGQRGR